MDCYECYDSGCARCYPWRESDLKDKNKKLVVVLEEIRQKAMVTDLPYGTLLEIINDCEKAIKEN